MSAIEYSPARYSASPRRLFEHAVDSFRLVAEALLRVLRLAVVELQEVMRLPQLGPTLPICIMSHSITCQPDLAAAA